MSQQEDLAMIRETFLAWNEGGVSADFARFFHPDVEWINPPEVPGGGTRIGKDAVLTFFREWEGTMGILDMSLQIEEIIPANGEYLVISVGTGTSGSGVVLPPQDWFHLFRIEDRLIRKGRVFFDRAAALEAAGLRE
jgi:ketosteroid isomerase-like protein